MFTPMDMSGFLAGPVDSKAPVLTPSFPKLPSTTYFELPMFEHRIAQFPSDGDTEDIKPFLSRVGDSRRDAADMGEIPPHDSFANNGDLDASISRTSFTAMNAALLDPFVQATDAPLQSRIDSHSFFKSSPPPSTATSPNSSRASKRRHESISTSISTPASTSTITSTSTAEIAEHVSVRALYLEKNCKAARKCRGKQKKQQDGLVETARNVERRNKVLKAEVELLKSVMRDLMGVVGRHTGCVDGRLRVYVEREAERLVPMSHTQTSTATY